MFIPEQAKPGDKLVIHFNPSPVGWPCFLKPGDTTSPADGPPDPGPEKKSRWPRRDPDRQRLDDVLHLLRLNLPVTVLTVPRVRTR